jgi:prepilin-type N-terminal cleavage/methylation domain-containing protein
MHRGFSILELLTVCVIIALLASMLLSAVANARRQAQKVACRVVIRSYVIGFSENQGRLVITIPQEANCHECHNPRYNAGLYLDTIDSRKP